MKQHAELEEPIPRSTFWIAANRDRLEQEVADYARQREEQRQRHEQPLREQPPQRNRE